MKQDEYSAAKAEATEIQHLNPSGPDRRQSNELNRKCIGRSLYYVWGPTRRHAIKEGSKAATLDTNQFLVRFSL